MNVYIDYAADGIHKGSTVANFPLFIGPES